MGALDLSFHLLSFAAPALTLALLLALAGRVLFPRQRALLGWWWQVALTSTVGVAVLALGLWHFGVDGKMATYTALAVAAAAAQWVGSAGWRA
jgi:hypothetical protein